MKYASVCSGIEAASVAWEPLGWRPAWFSEIEPFPSAVLAHRFPNVPNMGDMTKIKGDEHGAIDLLVGGTPCQDLSIAGKRMGFAGKRSVLAIDFVRLAYESGAKWFAWENVPGVFSSNGGEDFAQLLSLFAGWQVDTPSDGWGRFGIVEQSPGCFGLAWRVLDVQYARVDGFPNAIPQRRNRVFVVGYLGDWRRAAQVLFEPEGLLGNTPPRREAGKGTARSVTNCLRARSGDPHREDSGNYVAARMTAFGQYEIDGTASTMKQRDYKDATDLICYAASGFGQKVESDVASTLSTDHDDRVTGNNAALIVNQGVHNVISVNDVLHGDKSCNGHQEAFRVTFNDTNGTRKDRPNGGCYVTKADVSGCLTQAENEIRIVQDTMATQGVAVAFSHQGGGVQTTLGYDPKHGTSPTLAKCQTPAIHQLSSVRRLTPIECDRLMGFPSDWTRIPWRGKPAEDCPDGPRYKACGNSMGVNVMRWIGIRIQEVVYSMKIHLDTKAQRKGV